MLHGIYRLYILLYILFHLISKATQCQALIAIFYGWGKLSIEKTTNFPILMRGRVVFKTSLLNSELVHLTSFKVQVGLKKKKVQAGISDKRI